MTLYRLRHAGINNNTEHSDVYLRHYSHWADGESAGREKSVNAILLLVLVLIGNIKATFSTFHSDQVLLDSDNA